MIFLEFIKISQSIKSLFTILYIVYLKLNHQTLANYILNINILIFINPKNHFK